MSIGFRNPPYNIFYKGETENSNYEIVRDPQNGKFYTDDELVGIFRNFYKKNQFNDTYKATDACNPVTGRLIIFYRDVLLPFVKNKIKDDSSVIILCMFFFNIFFYWNYFLYSDNEKSWVKHQIKIFKELVETTDHSKENKTQALDFINDLTHFTQVDSSTETQYVSIDNNYQAHIVKNPQYKDIFLEFIKIIKKFYRSYYTNHFIHIDEYLIKNIDFTPRVIPYIQINITDYDYPIIFYNYNLFKFIAERKYDALTATPTQSYNETQYYNESLKTLLNAIVRGCDPGDVKYLTEMFNHVGTLLESVHSGRGDQDISDINEAFSYTDTDWDSIFSSHIGRQYNFPQQEAQGQEQQRTIHQSPPAAQGQQEAQGQKQEQEQERTIHQLPGNDQRFLPFKVNDLVEVYDTRLYNKTYEKNPIYLNKHIQIMGFYENNEGLKVTFRLNADDGAVEDSRVSLRNFKRLFQPATNGGSINKKKHTNRKRTYKRKLN